MQIYPDDVTSFFPEPDFPDVIAQDYPVLLNDAGPDGRLHAYKIFDFLQDCASIHAARLGIGLPQLHELGIIWVLSRIKVEMSVQPMLGDILHITTWPSGINRLFATRQYEISSARTGTMIGKGSSFWLTLKRDTLRPVLPETPLKRPLPANPDRPVFFPDLGKLPSSPAEDPVVCTVDASRIDYNRHMNNAYYAMFSQNWLAGRLGQLVRFKWIQLNFNHAVKFGEAFTCAGSIDQDTSAFSVEGVSSGGLNVFQAAGEYVTL